MDIVRSLLLTRGIKLFMNTYWQVCLPLINNHTRGRHSGPLQHSVLYTNKQQAQVPDQVQSNWMNKLIPGISR
jgi:hypothetical protein